MLNIKKKASEYDFSDANIEKEGRALANPFQ